MKKYFALFLGFSLVTSCGVLGRDGAKRSKSVHLTNRSSSTIDLYGQLSKSSASDKCRSSEAHLNKTIAPGQTDSIDLEMHCIGRPNSNVRVTLEKSYDVYQFAVSGPNAVALFTPGFRFNLGVSSSSDLTPVEVVATTKATDLTRPWLLPADETPGHAWLSENLPDGSVLVDVTAAKDAVWDEVAFTSGTIPSDWAADFQQSGGYSRLKLEAPNPGPSLVFATAEDTVATLSLTCTDDGCNQD